MIEYIIERIKAAELVLVGLGEELDELSLLRKSRRYQELTGKISAPWMIPFAEKIMIDEMRGKEKSAYERLSSVLSGKNYFIVSLCQDGQIREGGLDRERIVEPCGGYDQLQCSSVCSKELYLPPEELLNQFRGIAENADSGDSSSSLSFTDMSGGGELREPVCPHCGNALVFNNVSAQRYLEEGYLEQWSHYRKWLQGTVNRRVCILEIGVGMKYPTVIRWPFEKIVFYNQKAELFRIHSSIYQVPEEIRERAHGICQDPEEFFKELSNVL